MPAPFVLIDEPLDAATGGSVGLPPQAHHHLSKVLRLRGGATVEVADGHGRRCRGVLDADRVRLLGEVVHDRALSPRIHVLQGMPMGRKHDEVVRMLTELGVEQVTAVVAERTQSRPGEDKAGRLAERWRSVARAACEQARRSRLPVADGPMMLEEALGGLDEDCLLLAAHLGATVDPLAAIPDEVPATVVVAVGPEGGWSPEEAQLLQDRGATLVGLGPSVIRTEHAALVLAAVVAAATARMAVPAEPWE